jgi:hypothetical protein
MESVQAIVLGQPPKDPDEGDERVANMMKILAKVDDVERNSGSKDGGGGLFKKLLGR